MTVFDTNYDNERRWDKDSSAATSYIGAEYKSTYKIHLEKGTKVLRLGTKRKDQRVSGLIYYTYDIYCSRDVLIGKIIQTSLMQDMGPSHEWFRHGGLCSLLTLNLSGLYIDYRGHNISTDQAHLMTIGDLLTEYYSGEERDNLSSKKSVTIYLVGKMDVHLCLPCCCFIPKLLSPGLIPWNKYDLFNPEADFDTPPISNKMDERFDNLPPPPPPTVPEKERRRSAGNNSMFDKMNDDMENPIMVMVEASPVNPELIVEATPVNVG